MRIEQKAKLLTTVMAQLLNISLVYQSRELCTDKRILFQKAKPDLSLTSV